MTLAVIVFAVLIIALTHWFGPLCCLTPSRPPVFLSVLTIMIALTVIAAALFRLARPWPPLITIFSLTLAAMFLVLKAELLGGLVSAGLRAISGQSGALAAAVDLRWLGFSYITFRLLQALRDRASGRLPALSLQEFVTYALFFPTLAAGPIDRSERFVKGLRPSYAISMPDGVEAG